MTSSGGAVGKGLRATVERDGCEDYEIAVVHLRHRGMPSLRQRQR
jgi:hypothetical protein